MALRITLSPLSLTALETELHHASYGYRESFLRKGPEKGSLDRKWMSGSHVSFVLLGQL